MSNKNCEMCQYPIRSRVSFVDQKIHCNNCDHIFYRTFVGIYVGMIDFFHIFNLDRPFDCPECGMRALNFTIPCEDENYFDMSSFQVNTSKDQHRENWK